VGLRALSRLPVALYDFTSVVKSDDCSTRKARISRTNAGNQDSALSGVIALNPFKSKFSECASNVRESLRHALWVTLQRIGHRKIKRDGEHQLSRGSSKIPVRR
jgi:hypothetical protein